MAPPTETYELYAIRYATRAGRRSDHFIGGDPHDGPMPMDYFVWAAVCSNRVFVIDTGFGQDTATKRGRTLLRNPVEALRLVGIDPNVVTDVVITHLHYDHAGNLGCFPSARFHIQEREMHFAAGRHMKHAHIAHPFEVEDVVDMIRLNFGGQVVMHDGFALLAEGLSLHHTGGHSAGLQFVRVHTARGWVVIASDASHFYENMESRRPFSVAYDIGAMLETFDALYAAAPTPDHIVPGHDPQVMARYPAARPELEGIVVRLDVAPSPATGRK